MPSSLGAILITELKDSRVALGCSYAEMHWYQSNPNVWLMNFHTPNSLLLKYQFLQKNVTNVAGISQLSAFFSTKFARQVFSLNFSLSQLFFTTSSNVLKTASQEGRSDIEENAKCN